MSMWINELTKSQAVEYSRRHGINDTANLDTLRKRIRQFTTRNPGTPRPVSVTDDMPRAENDDVEAPIAPEPLDRPQLLNQIRKWGCQFDGKEPLAFLERVEELKDAYGFSGEQMLLGLSELLRGNALLWLRNCRSSWQKWEDFCEAFRAHFLPPRLATSTRRSRLRGWRGRGR